jgi:hypothetical protein
MNRRKLVVWLAVCMLVVPALPASAVNEYLCDPATPSAFSDVPVSSPFTGFIDCLVFWEVTSGTSPTTFSPAAPVERWQMALFLSRLWVLTTAPLTDSDQGFTDIASLTPEAQAAINQAAQLSITTGVAPGLYAPHEPVSRWQMAIFLSRFVRATRLVVPAPSTSGFVDIGGLSIEAQDSISIVKSLGITTGTSTTTYSPDDVVTREQMAAFLTRTLQATWSLAAGVFTDTCSTNSEGVELCTGSGIWWTGVPLRFLHTWYIELPADLSGIDHPGTTMQFSIDGVLQPAAEISVTLSGVRYRSWEVLIPGGLSGQHVLEARGLGEGILRFVDTVTVTFE